MIGERELRSLTAGRWLVPIMAHLDEASGSRFAAMLALGPSRATLAASLTQLRDAGWVRRNAGHGHPLRPEYLLTDAGAPVAAFARSVMASRARLGLEPDRLSRWSLPVVIRLDGGEARFSALRDSLRPVTPRALSLTLKQLLGARLIERELEDDFPPVPIYGLTGRGARLAEAMR